MNGININTFFSHAGVSPFKKENVNDNQKSTNVKMPGKKAEEKKNAINDTKDTVEINSSFAKTKQATYSKPVKQMPKEETKWKDIDENGIQEGVKLSDSAKELLGKLKEKYGNMDFFVAGTDSAEEESYYLSKGTKDYSVLIDPETLESMAADEDVLAKYEGILDNTGNMFDTIKEKVGEENMKNIGTINISFDKNGKTSYIIELFEEMNRVEHNDHKSQKKPEKKVTRIEADSQEELIEKIQEKLKQKKEVQDTDEDDTEE